MNKAFLSDMLRRNWYLVAVLVVCAAWPAYKLAGGSTKTDGGETGVIVEPEPPVPTPPSVEERTLATIKEHGEQIEADPDAPDAPARLAAMGNLYLQKLGNYQEAARCYELVLVDYPEWEGVGNVYIQVATCYERLEDRQNARRIYEKMLEHFPPDAQEYAYAQGKLAGEIP